MCSIQDFASAVLLSALVRRRERERERDDEEKEHMENFIVCVTFMGIFNNTLA